MPSHVTSTQPDYVLHLPHALAHGVPMGLGTIALGGGFYLGLHPSHPKLARFLGATTVLLGGVFIGITTFLTYYLSVERRLKARDRLLEAIPWRGDEIVLDVGCGNGILILSAAKHLITGQGIGIDIWQENAGESRPEKFRQNAKIEGVADRVSLRNEDARQLPYSNDFFDVIISSLATHHMGHGADTQRVMAEMKRTLKPGGRIAIFDDPFTINTWVKLMQQQGLTIEQKQLEYVVAIKA